MILSRAQLINALVAGAVPTAAWLSASESIQGNTFATVSREWVTATWQAGIEALRANAPALVESRAIGGSKTVLVPRYVINGFNCRGHSLSVYSHGMIGFALQGASARPPLDHDALAFGILNYTAEPRAENLQRNGRHRILWFIDHEGVFQTFEGGDGAEEELTPAELASITFLFAQ